MSQRAVDISGALGTPRFASAGRTMASAPTQERSPCRERQGQGGLIGLEENLQTQLHVEGFSGSDAGGSVKVADGVGDRATTRTCGA